LVLAPLGAQVRVETFDGPGLPKGWTARRGTWSIKNGRAIQTMGTWGYLTLNGVKLKNCVVEADVYWGGAAVQFGGVAARHDGSAGDNACMVKVQSNSSTVQGFDTLWNYERPGGSVSKTGIAPVMTKTRIRLMVLGNQGMLFHDSTQDGIFDTMVGPRTYTAHTAAGEVGITGYTSSASAPAAIDNFALYDAVLMAEGSSTPKVGTTYQMRLTTQHTTIVPYRLALSLTNGGTKNGKLGGLPIGAGQFIPLGIDPLLDLSIALGGTLGLVGITDLSGVGKPTLKIPNISSLVGVGFHAAGVTSVSGRFGNISNNHYIKIVQ